jgi:hypothetical protein
MILPLTHWRRGHHVRSPAPMVLLLRQGCPSGTPPVLVSTTGASPSSRNRHDAGLLRRGHTPVEEEGAASGREMVRHCYGQVRAMLGREPPLPRRGRSCRATCLDPWERESLLHPICSQERRERVESCRIRPRIYHAGIWLGFGGCAAGGGARAHGRGGWPVDENGYATVAFV